MANACLHASALPVELHVIDTALLPPCKASIRWLMKWCRVHCSRNNMLSEEERVQATCIHQALKWAQNAAASGEASTTTKLCEGVRQRIADGGGRVDYVEASWSDVDVSVFRHGLVCSCTTRLVSIDRHYLSTSAVFCLAASMQISLQSSHNEMCISTWQAVDAEELQPLDSLAGRHVLVAVAAFFGSVRLIDNVVLEPT